MKLAALILMALLVPGGSIALAVYLRRQWLARDAAEIDTLIRAPRPVFDKLTAKEYDAVLAEAARRYAAESYRKKQAAQIASGEGPPIELKIARKA